MKNWLKENWYKILVIILGVLIITILLRIEFELIMIHKYTADINWNTR